MLLLSLSAASPTPTMIQELAAAVAVAVVADMFYVYNDQQLHTHILHSNIRTQTVIYFQVV